MALFSASTPSSLPSVGVRLNNSNYLLWKTRFKPLLRAYQLLDYVEGVSKCPPPTIPPPSPSPSSATTTAAADPICSECTNPAFTAWVLRDQLALGWILQSIEDSIVPLLIGAATSHDAWTILERNYALQNQARVMQLRNEFQQLTKGASPMTEYLTRAKVLIDSLAAIGRPLSPDEITSRVLFGLGPAYSSFRSVLNATGIVHTFDSLHGVLLTEEATQLLELSSTTELSAATPMAHLAAMPRHSSTSSTRPPYPSPPPNYSYNPSPNPPTHFPNSSQPSTFTKNRGSRNFRPKCQVCHRHGHTALSCHNRYNPTYQPRFSAPQNQQPPPQAHATQARALLPTPGSSSSSDLNWYPDSGATHHVTQSLADLSLQSVYDGPEQVQIGDGSGLRISHQGTSTFLSHNRKFYCRDILHVPAISKNLLSVSRFASDNNCFFEFHPSFCFVKDRRTGTILLKGVLRDGLYVLPSIRLGPSPSALLSAVSPPPSFTTWHHRLGHPAFPVVRKILSRLAPSLRSNKSDFCSACTMSKCHKLPFSISNSVSNAPLQLIHCDVWGPSPILSNSGYRYYIHFLDDYSKFSWFYPLAQRSDVFDVFVKFRLHVENVLHTKIQFFQSDGAGEFLSKRFQTELLSHGIGHRLSCPHTPQQNGAAERKHRHIVETGLALLYHSHAPLKFWDFAFETAVFLINRLPTLSLHNKTPWEMLFHTPPTYSALRSFGSRCFPYLRPYAPHKLAPRSTPCIFLGYPSGHVGYRCLDPSTGRIFVSRHVFFDESTFPYHSPSSPVPESLRLPFTGANIFPQAVQVPSLSTPSSTQPPAAALPLVPPVLQPPAAASPVPQPPAAVSPLLQPPAASPTASQPPAADSLEVRHTAATSSALLPPVLAAPVPQPTVATNSPPLLSSSTSSTHSMITRSQDGTRKPRVFSTVRHPVALTVHPVDCEPQSFSQANSHPQWREAMSDEYHALISNGTWTLVHPPSRCNIIGCKWVYKIKRKSDDTIDRYKARLVAKGFNQQEGIDYHDTFSPVIKPVTIRLVLSLAVSGNWPLRQLDVKNAFLHGHLHEEVYMQQPPGFIDPAHPDKVCRLHRSLYGLKQAPRAWFTRLSSFLSRLGFAGSRADSSLFIQKTAHHVTYILVYVDDIVLTGSSPRHIDELITSLASEFAMTDLGPLKYFLGIEVHRASSQLVLTQSKYILDLLRRTHMDSAKPLASPISASTCTSPPDTSPHPDPSQYRSVVGALQYLMLTRPDIAYAVNQACLFMHAPTASHWTQVKRLLRYLKFTINHGLRISSSPSATLHAYSDADWAGDSHDRRSVGGFSLFFGNSLISWSSKKHKTVSRSSTESEYKAMANATCEVMWVESLLRELGIRLSRPPTLWCDNLSAIYLTANPIFHARTKHIEIDFHFVRERVSRRQLIVRFIASIDQIADIFTKGLSVSRFNFLKSKLHVCEPHINLRGTIGNQPNPVIPELLKSGNTSIGDSSKSRI